MCYRSSRRVTATSRGPCTSAHTRCRQHPHTLTPPTTPPLEKKTIWYAARFHRVARTPGSNRRPPGLMAVSDQLNKHEQIKKPKGLLYELKQAQVRCYTRNFTCVLEHGIWKRDITSVYRNDGCCAVSPVVALCSTLRVCLSVGSPNTASCRRADIARGRLRSQLILGHNNPLNTGMRVHNKPKSRQTNIELIRNISNHRA